MSKNTIFMWYFISVVCLTGVSLIGGLHMLLYGGFLAVIAMLFGVGYNLYKVIDNE